MGGHLEGGRREVVHQEVDHPEAEDVCVYEVAEDRLDVYHS